MSEREELAYTIHTRHCLERVHSELCTFWFDDLESADAVLEAGYRKNSDAKLP